MIMKMLYLIPARGGSKGIPHKNIRDFCGKPLVCYSIDAARELAADADICVSTDDPAIIDVAERAGLEVPFVRPKEFATDTASSEDVMRHAVDFYKKRGIRYEAVVLLQPTSPLRTARHIKEAIDVYSKELDMVVGVTRTQDAVTLMREEEDGNLVHVFDRTQGVRRQDATEMYKINGAVYVINSRSLEQKGMAGFERIRKYVMPEASSVDIDTELDWMVAEEIYRKTVRQTISEVERK